MLWGTFYIMLYIIRWTHAHAYPENIDKPNIHDFCINIYTSTYISGNSRSVLKFGDFLMWHMYLPLYIWNLTEVCLLWDLRFWSRWISLYLIMYKICCFCIVSLKRTACHYPLLQNYDFKTCIDCYIYNVCITISLIS